YTVVVTDSKGCTQSDAVTVGNTNGGTASASVVTNVTCNGGNNGSASAAITGGASPFTYSWNSTPAQTTATATGLPAGLYIVTVTDAGGCKTPASVTISEPTAIVAKVTSVNATCGNSNGSASVTATGGTGVLIYSWSNNVT